MIRYITRRLLLFIPTLVVISLLAFIISVNAPGDPVDQLLNSYSNEGTSTQSINRLEQRQYWRKKLGLDLPLFYISIHSLAEPSSIEKFPDNKEQEAIRRVIRETGNTQQVTDYFAAIDNFFTKINSTNNSEKTDLSGDLIVFKSSFNRDEITRRLNFLTDKFRSSQPEISSEIANLVILHQRIYQSTNSWRNLIPVFNFQLQNQYHRWVFGDGTWLTGSGAVLSKGIIRGDFGISYLTRQPVSRVISEKVGWSMFFSLLSVFIAYLVSVPIGVWAGASKDSLFDRSSSVIVFILYSLPSFWIATMLLMLFANPDHFHIFPASGVKPPLGYPEDAGFFECIQLSLPYIVLPLICYTYSSFAFLSRTMRVATLESMNQDYIRTARAKGLPFNLVVFRHAFRNSLLPLITVFANVFPLAIGGSVILETIFSIPGMGLETVLSIQNQNYPMIVAIFTITGFLTMTGYLVSDILYAWADPRISLTTKR